MIEKVNLRPVENIFRTVKDNQKIQYEHAIHFCKCGPGIIDIPMTITCGICNQTTEYISKACSNF